jgi:hypothetical protein
MMSLATLPQAKQNACFLHHCAHAAASLTMRYTHTNLDSKHAAVAKLESFGDNLVTPAVLKTVRLERASGVRIPPPPPPFGNPIKCGDLHRATTFLVASFI